MCVSIDDKITWKRRCFWRERREIW